MHFTKPGQAYRDPNGLIWIVEAFYAGPAVIFANDKEPHATRIGVVHLANRDLGYRIISTVDNPKLDKLERVNG